jgi:glycerophosphoryl diester phosphodiesterase
MRPFTQRPSLVGHRGCGSVPPGLPENTVASFLAAVDHGADWIELDVRRTADDRLVLVHHATLPDERFVADVSGAEAAGAGAESLQDAFDAIPEGVGIDVDVKTSLEDALRTPAASTIGLLVPVLLAELRRRPLLVTSFDPAALIHVRDHAPGVSTGLLTWKHFPLRKAIPAAAHLGLDAVLAHVPSFGPNDVDPAPVHRATAHSVEVAHAAGLDVGAWCPRPDEARALVEAGVDALVVNDLLAVREALVRDA